MDRPVDVLHGRLAALVLKFNAGTLVDTLRLLQCIDRHVNMAQLDSGP